MLELLPENAKTQSRGEGENAFPAGQELSQGCAGLPQPSSLPTGRPELSPSTLCLELAEPSPGGRTPIFVARRAVPARESEGWGSLPAAAPGRRGARLPYPQRPPGRDPLRLPARLAGEAGVSRASCSPPLA